MTFHIQLYVCLVNFETKNHKKNKKYYRTNQAIKFSIDLNMITLKRVAHFEVLGDFARELLIFETLIWWEVK